VAKTIAEQKPIRIINAVAPIRICDNGGWTDTWFAKYGAVFNIAVSPYAEVQVAVYPQEATSERIWLVVENYGDRYAVDLDADGWDRHPLLEAAIKQVGVPPGIAVEISIFSQAPSGASTGTSAAITVALVGALDCLTPGRMGPQAAAMAAHRVETEMLARQSGIQDQLGCAYGGINYIAMSVYPEAQVTPIKIAEPLWWELERGLALIYLGKSHDSSQVHEKVIAGLEDAGPDSKQLEDLRDAAARSRQALVAGDLNGLGRAMIENTEAQARLHPDLVSPDARRVIAIAREHGATGWKVNGAGGEGGSLALLCGPDGAARRAMLREIEAESPLWKNIPIRLDRYGLRRWESGEQGIGGKG
jgi:D-glycero-alpha-D-manno-heptose-7-phosphate kinase